MHGSAVCGPATFHWLRGVVVLSRLRTKVCPARWLAVVAFHAVVLMLFGFAAVYSRFYAESGWIGLVGFFRLKRWL